MSKWLRIDSLLTLAMFAAWSARANLRDWTSARRTAARPRPAELGGDRLRWN